MTTQPTPASPAEVCERLKNWQWFCENTAKAFLRYEMPIEHIKELGETLTSALLLIEHGEKERERLDFLARLLDSQKWADSGLYGLRPEDEKYINRDTLRQAIDAARAQPTPESK